MKERLKLIAKYYGRSLRGLSRNSGLHPATLSAIVYNDKISVKSLVKIHKSYPINMHWLITGEGQITPPNLTALNTRKKQGSSQWRRPWSVLKI